MSKLNLSQVPHGVSNTVTNKNFKEVQDVLNNDVLKRRVSVGEDNTMHTDIDMNNNRIYNLPKPKLNHEAARYEEFKIVEEALPHVQNIESNVKKAQDSAEKAEKHEKNAQKIKKEVEKEVDKAAGFAKDAEQSAKEAAHIAVGELPHKHLIMRDAPDSHPASAISFKEETLEDKLKRDVLTIWDFFTKEEYEEYKAKGVSFDASDIIQRFFDSLSDRPDSIGEITGTFGISKTIKVGGGNSVSSLTIMGNLNLHALNTMDVMLEMVSANYIRWIGRIRVIGTGSDSWESRTCKVGVLIGNAAARQFIDSITAQFFSEYGVLIRDKSSLSSIDYIRPADCGSGYDGSENNSLKSSFSVLGKTGSSGSTGQRSQIKVDVLPPELVHGRRYLDIEGEVYAVYDVNEEEKEISIYPWLPDGVEEGTLRYIFGAGVAIFGGDSSVLTLGQLDLMRNGIGLLISPLYPPHISSVVAQANGVGVMVGSRHDAASVGGVVGQLYTEINNHDIVFLSSTAKIQFQNTIATKKYQYLTFRNSRGDKVLGMTFSEYGLPYKGIIRRKTKGSSNFLPSSKDIDVTEGVECIVYRDRYQTYRLIFDKETNNLFGSDSTTLIHIGTKADLSPEGVTFRTADPSHTINGSPDNVTFNDFKGPAVFTIFFNTETNDFIVTNLTAPPEKVYETDIEGRTLGAGEVYEVVHSVSGLSGVFLKAKYSRPLGGVQVWSEAASNSQLKTFFLNPTLNEITVPSGVLSVFRG